MIKYQAVHNECNTSAFCFQPELTQVLRRSCATILERGGIIRKMENLGHKTLPYKMSVHGQRHTTGRSVQFWFEMFLTHLKIV